MPPLALVLFQSMVAEDERSSGAWHAEWQPLRESLRIAAGAARNGAQLVHSLRVRPAMMAANLELTGGAIVSERLHVALVPRLGKAAAKRLLAGATARVEHEGTDLLQVLTADLAQAGLSGALDPPYLADLLNPAAYTGICGSLVDRALTRLDTLLKESA